MKFAIHDSYSQGYAVFSAPENTRYMALVSAVEEGYLQPMGGKEDWDEEIEQLVSQGYSVEEAEEELFSFGYELVGPYYLDISTIEIIPVPPNVECGIYDSLESLKHARYMGVRG